LHISEAPAILNSSDFICGMRRFQRQTGDWMPRATRSEPMRVSYLQLLIKLRGYLLFGALLIMAGTLFAASGIYSFTLNSIDGKPAPLADYKGKVVLVVNVASQCGYTPQYSALEATYEKYKDQGFVILGFPANNFGAQEPGTNEEIKTFCTRKYSVTFPMYAKISVKGPDQAPLYAYLTKDTAPGITGDIKWNFTKFLIDRNGNVVQRFEPAVTPDSKEVVAAIEKQLKP
jgi:glutathione peroxidase